VKRRDRLVEAEPSPGALRQCTMPSLTAGSVEPCAATTSARPFMGA
jgi:hypothetical protein